MKPIFIALLLLFCACDAPPTQVELTGLAMGTHFSVKLPAGIGDRDALLIRQQIEKSLQQVEQMMSTYRIDSEISRFNASELLSWFAVSREFCVAVEEAIRVSELTGGAFDITVGPVVNLWGFGPGDYVDEPPAPERIDALLASVGYEHLEADCLQPAIRKAIPGLVLDMSAFGKGYAVDRLGELLDAMGFKNYLVEVGGELRARGHNARGQLWAIGIERPLPDQREPHTVLHVSDVAVATSGDYRNFFEHDGTLYSHTIDPRTGKPVTHELASVTVVSPNGAQADALATALLVLGPDAGMTFAQQQQLAVLFLMRKGNEIRERTTTAFDALR